jgi:hypothetical protein
LQRPAQHAATGSSQQVAVMAGMPQRPAIASLVLLALALSLQLSAAGEPKGAQAGPQAGQWLCRKLPGMHVGRWQPCEACLGNCCALDASKAAKLLCSRSTALPGWLRPPNVDMPPPPPHGTLQVLSRPTNRPPTGSQQQRLQVRGGCGRAEGEGG